MISGNISGQSLVSEVERDSAVAKIVRGKECAELAAFTSELVVEADKTIMAQKNVIKSQDKVILNYSKQQEEYNKNIILLKKSIENEKLIGKKYRKKNFISGLYGVGIGSIIGFILFN